MTDEAVMAATAAPVERERRGALSTIGWLLLLGVVIRLALAPWFGGFGYDIKTLRDWAGHLLNDPLSRFYAVADSPDHLPGDLWLLLGGAKIYTWLGGESFRGKSFLMLVKSIPTIFDVLVAVLLYAIVRGRAGVSAGIAAVRWSMFNPAFIFLTAVWGQWDTVSGALLLAGILLVFRRDELWYWSAPLFAWATLIKPQMALIVAIVYLIPIIDAWWQSHSFIGALRLLWWRAIATGGLAVATICLLALPFRVGLPGFHTRWMLTDRISLALNLYPKITLGACNIWMIYAGSLNRYSDVRRQFLGLTPHAWGTVLFVLALIFVLGTMAWQVRVAVTPVISWTALAAAFAFFMLPTRVHERYLFPAVMLAIMLAGLTGFPRWGRWIAGVLTISYLLNLVMVYGSFRHFVPNGVEFFAMHALFRGLSLANVVLFVVVLALPYTQGWRDSLRAWNDVQKVQVPMIQTA